jgi:hypothetical protein
VRNQTAAVLKRMPDMTRIYPVLYPWSQYIDSCARKHPQADDFSKNPSPSTIAKSDNEIQRQTESHGGLRKEVNGVELRLILHLP